jgi:putative endonuclease
VDLVAVDAGVLACAPLEAVDGRKQRRMITAARHFLAMHGGAGLMARFDVIGIMWDEGAPRLEHVRDAFRLD